MNINVQVNNATLKTANGDGLLRIVGNTNITEAINVNGDSEVKQNSLVNGELKVNGTSLLNGDVTISHQITVPVINVTHLYQPSNWLIPDSSGITISGAVDSGTVFFISHGTTITLPVVDINLGTNYQAIVTSNLSSINNTILFTSSGTIYYRIVGTYAQTANFNNIYCYTDTDLGTVGSINTYVFNTSWSIPQLTSTGMQTGTNTNLNFNITEMTLGDYFDLIYIGNNNWVINGYINSLSSFST